ncbi:MAG: DUF4383 domain-containing protein, partial [Betaproteobacteria bacterium]
MKTSTFALIIGIAYLGAGILGLIPAALVPPPIDAPPTNFTLLYGYLLGLFPVNLLHSLVHIVIGAWGISAWSGRSSSISFARGLAILYGALAVLGMFPLLNTAMGMIPIHGNDVWLHGITAVVAAYFGWRQPAGISERRHILGDRRQRMF